MSTMRGRPPAGLYRIRRATTQGRWTQYEITIPTSIAEHVPRERAFRAEWHDDGILLRAVDEAEVAELPEWAKEES